jgi:catechol 2,3-dioxygenase
MAISTETGFGAVALTVSDRSRAADFYERVLGLEGGEGDDGTLTCSVAGGEPLVELVVDAAAPPLDSRATGLFHLAILMPSRRDLMLALRRLVDAGWPLTGASDHLVSEALYLSDPDGNGIEIYRDRPRDQWPHRDGSLQMATLPLDLDDLMGELHGSDERAERAPAGTRIGHVHLQVAALEPVERFYAGVLGFEVMVRTYPGALFVAAGGYHHHIGLNTWHSAGAARPASGAIGLRNFAIELPDKTELDSLVAACEAGGAAPERVDGGSALVRDPSGNGVLLTARASSLARTR